MRCEAAFIVCFATAAIVVAQPFMAVPSAEPAPNTLTAKERTDGWRLLFDGRTTSGWRGYRQATLPSGWQAIDGVLTRVGQAGDIVTIDEFADFELTLEWKLPP